VLPGIVVRGVLPGIVAELTLGIVAAIAAAALLVAARAIGSVITVRGIVVFPTHGDEGGTTSVGMTSSGLVPPTPASIAVAGTVASPYVNAVVVARPGMVATAPPTPNPSIRAVALAVGSQAPVWIDAPKG
jgi:hypothetical protein